MDVMTDKNSKLNTFKNCNQNWTIKRFQWEMFDRNYRKVSFKISPTQNSYNFLTHGQVILFTRTNLQALNYMNHIEYGKREEKKI